MSIQTIESQVLELLVNLIQTDGPELAAEFLDELVVLIEGYIPASTLSQRDKVSWVDIRNTLETNVLEAVLKAIAALIAGFAAKTMS